MNEMKKFIVVLNLWQGDGRILVHNADSHFGEFFKEADAQTFNDGALICRVLGRLEAANPEELKSKVSALGLGKVEYQDSWDE